MFNDIIHHTIELSADCRFVINTRPFQRLRHLKQLGFTQYVYPSATHDRFAHSLGVAHMARMFCNWLKNIHGKELELDERDVFKVELAGLCHDLGHGPFSHVCENMLLPRLRPNDDHWTHESMSVKLLDYIIENNDVDRYKLDLNDKEIAQIKALMTGESVDHDGKNMMEDGKMYLFNIVANKKTGLDVDKLDYLMRDANYTGVKLRCDPLRLLKRSMVVGDQIAYRPNEYREVLDVFRDRAEMHRKVYSHRKVKAIDLMMVDALEALEPELQIVERLQTVKGFLSLDDSVASEARRLADKGSTPSARKALELFERIENRKLYKLVQEIVVPATDLKATPSASDITTHQRSNGRVSLCPEDIVVYETIIDHGMKEKNPMEAVRFCHMKGPHRGEVAEVFAENTSSFIRKLKSYQERRIRVYVKDCDNYAKADAVDVAVKEWLKHAGIDSQLATPSLSRKRQRSENGHAGPVQQQLSY